MTSQLLKITDAIWTSENHLWTLLATDSFDEQGNAIFIVRNLKTGAETSAWLQFGYDLVGSGISSLPGYVYGAVFGAIKSFGAAAELRADFPPGSTMTTLLRHVSASGMSRSISIVHNDIDITWTIARLLGESLDKFGGITVPGCGMDMGFHLVYSVSSMLYRNGFTCIGNDGDTRCPSNDHSNGDRDYSAHVHSSGGYAIKQRWL